MGYNVMNWNIYSASAIGEYHRQQGLPCQDATAYAHCDQWVVAVVCDGAGSARHSDLGANHAAEIIVQELMSMIPDMAPQGIRDARHFWQKAIIATIGNTRMRLMKKIAASQNDLSGYHATIVGTVAGPDYGLFFHIGDGAGFALVRGSCQATAVSRPENGEYSDQTFFYTMDNWRDHLRFTFFNRAEIITLMSDGAMSFVADKHMTGLDPKFMTPVVRYLDSVDECLGSNALAHTLDSPQTYAITGDDKTLMVIIKRT
jgi:hypothetical protein